MQNFGSRLKTQRKEKCFTQEQLAKKAGIMRTMVCRYETENQIPTVEILLRLADALDVSVDYLLGRTTMKAVCKSDSHDEAPLPFLQEQGLVTCSKNRPDGSQCTTCPSWLPSSQEEFQQLVLELVEQALDRTDPDHRSE